MHQIPLKVLIIDPDRSAANLLADTLREIDVVLSVHHRETLNQASEALDQLDINAIYIDPLGLGIDPASRFIFDVRRKKRHVVFVLYYDFEEQKRVSDFFYAGERRRFRGYFKLNKIPAGAEFMRYVQSTVDACQGDLHLNLTQEEISKLQKELSVIQRGASDNAVLVPTKILEDIQKQLAARKEETKAPGILNKPALFLGPLAPSVNSECCFVIMPYSQAWSGGVEAILRESCQEAGFVCQIAKTMDGRFVANDIWHGITGAGVIVADLTGGNANVAYEVGLADAIGREVILVCQETKVPFDFQGQRLIVYENTVMGALTLRGALTERLKGVKRKLSDNL